MNLIIASFALFISILGCLVAIASYRVNARPVLLFAYNAKKKIYQITNAGKTPALNLIVFYSISKKNLTWINPVKCYSIKSGDTLDLNWFFYEKSTLIEKSLGEEKIRNILHNEGAWEVGVGMGSYGVVYHSAFPFPLFNRPTYTSIMIDDDTKVHRYNILGKEAIKNPKRIWEIVTREDIESYSGVAAIKPY